MNCGIPKFSVYCVDQELLLQLMSGVRKWFIKLFIFHHENTRSTERVMKQ